MVLKRQFWLAIEHVINLIILVFDNIRLIVAKMLEFYRIEYDFFSLSIDWTFFEFFLAEGAPRSLMLRLVQTYCANNVFTSGAFIYASYGDLEANLAFDVFQKISSFADVDFDFIYQDLLGFDHLALDLFLNSFVVEVFWWLNCLSIVLHFVVLVILVFLIKLYYFL